ncbi:TetR/AcrR family transcriptional regulator [Dactylosporangium sp. CA-092794]|uniref:TetR/AcrR family transcriptional regulator n=1 Tax=Dactylosporangium sp. CA-092794 TaxID=3239929 RepID=UPI003D91D7DE
MPRRADQEPQPPAHRPPPQTARGARTRAALVAAARVVFERDGFLDSRLVDITAEASCAAGTFYTYFDTKEDILEAVLEQVRDDMLHPGLPHVEDAGDASAVIAASNRAYLEAYRRNAALMGVLEQVAATSERFVKIREDRADVFIDRNARSIARLQAEGRADPALDPMVASRALSGMLSRLAYTYFVSGFVPADVPYETLVATANRLWCNALGLPPPPD